MRIQLALTLLSMVILSSQSTPPPQLPTFKSGIDVVELDVTVLDGDRRPIRGLTADDFTVLEQGRPQPIVAFAAIDVPAPPLAAAPWVREAPIDVAANASENRRLVTIVMDDAYAPFDPDVMKRAKQIGYGAIDELGPNDLAAVIFTFQGRAQNFTSDRQKLRSAVGSFVPKTTGAGPPSACLLRLRGCDVSALSTVASTLRSAPAGRKIAILISGGRSFSFGEMGDPTSANEAPELHKMFEDLQRANVTVYTFDVRGLEVNGATAADRVFKRPSVSDNASLYSFAESTGGRAFADMNDPERHVPEAFQESSTYYLIGFRSTATANDSRYHKVEVKVGRPGVEIRTRNGYYAPAKRSAPTEAITGLPAGDLPLEATATAFAVPGRSIAEVIVVGHLLSPGTRHVSLQATAIDLDGRLHGTQTQTIEITPAPGSRGPNLLSHLPLPSGRFMIRLAAESEGSAGSVFVDVDVPNFSKNTLSMSGLLVERRPAAPLPDAVIAGLIPVAPTTQRTFTSGDEVTVFARVYQGGKGRLLPVRASAKVTNARNEVVSHQELVLEPEQFGTARAADYRVSLPLANLERGDYLYDVEVKSGAPLVRRTLRFSIAGP